MTAPGAIPGWGQPSQPGTSATPPTTPTTPAAPPPVAHLQPPPVQPAAIQPAAVRPSAPVAPVQPAARPPQALDDQPAARLPTAAVPPRPKPVASVEQRVAQPGDRICGSCGEANDPSRKFCRRCGASLTEARIVSAKKLPWYRRIFGGGAKQPKQYAAGERIDSMAKAAPKGGGGLGGVLKSIGLVRGLLGLVVALGAFGYIGIPSVQGAVNGLIQTVRTQGIGGIVDGITGLVNPAVEVERPVAQSASSAVESQGPELAFDTFSNTDWQATDKAPALTVTFAEPVDLRAVIIYPGNSKAFIDFRRPSRLEFAFPDGTTRAVDLEDVKDSQTFDVSADKVESVIIRVIEMKGPESAPLSISEIEFFKKSN